MLAHPIFWPGFQQSERCRWKLVWGSLQTSCINGSAGWDNRQRYPIRNDPGIGGGLVLSFNISFGLEKRILGRYNSSEVNY